MKRYNPFYDLSCAYGAPMGRHGDNPSNLIGVKRLHAKHQGKQESGYDNGGAYWGSPNNVWGVWGWIDGEICCVYVRAKNREDAIKKVGEGME